MLVGRDGQEIEGECGRRLAGEIDEVGGAGVSGGGGGGGGEMRGEFGGGGGGGRGEGPRGQREGWGTAVAGPEGW